MPETNYNIRSLKGLAPDEHKVYLFDANVWLLILRPPLQLKDYEKVYIDFVDSILEMVSTSKKPCIYINGLILSEVYNAFMRTGWDAFRTEQREEITFKEYRGTDDFENQLQVIKSDFIAYKPSIVSDPNLYLDPLDILDQIPFNTDYNDYYYFELAVEKGLSIVTNDKDFIYQGIEILTNNGKLLSI